MRDMLEYLHNDRMDRFNGKAIEKKALHSLLGICNGLIADNELNEREFLYLRQWLLENQLIADEWPGSMLVSNINEILEDGVITQEELDTFKTTLINLQGGSFDETGAVGGLSTELPINKSAVVTFEGTAFCFTGTFLRGTRKVCKDLTEKAGGIVLDTPIKGTDYLVVGTIATKSWTNTSFGRKIKKVVDLQEQGHDIYIISEQMWQAALNIEK